MNKTHKLGILTILLILISIFIADSLSFIEPVRIGDGDTIDNASEIRKSGGIRCKWGYSADTENITVYWYNNSVFYDSIKWTSGNLENYTDILPSALTESEIWNCTVILTNSSAINYTDSAIVEIIYDPPVYINTSIPYDSIQNQTQEISEDLDYSLTWNTTGSYIEYTFAIAAPQRFCSDAVSQHEGSGICTPTSSYLGADLNTMGLANITFQYQHASGIQQNTITFIIVPVNDAPTYNAPNESINQGETWAGVDARITVSDEESNFPINFTAEVPAFCTWTNTSTYIEFECITTPSMKGNFSINITATDNPPYNETYPLIPQTTSKSFFLEVVEVNHLPNITYYTNYNSSQGLDYNITFNATDQFDNNSLNFSIIGDCNITNPWTNVNSTYYDYYDGENVSTYGTGTWNGTLTNNHIICRNVTLLVEDESGGNNSVYIMFNISNVNDPPEIYNFSAYSINNLNNTNINNLTGYTQAPFSYRINATDVDLLVEYNPNIDSFRENLTYYTNSSWLRTYLDNKTGLINISSSDMNLTLGNYSFFINVTDNGNPFYNDTVIMSLEVFSNSPPAFNQTLNFSCKEYNVINWNQPCFIDVSQYAYDPDNATGDYITSFSDNSGIFNILGNGTFYFNATQNMVGLNTFNISITDSRGSTHSEIIYLYINNTNNMPNITSIEPRDAGVVLQYNNSNNNPIQINVSDSDLSLTGTNISDLDYAYERLNFTWVNNGAANLSDYISIRPNLTTSASNIYLIVNMTINGSSGLFSPGSYSLNITVTDNYLNHTGVSTNDSDTYMYNFTVYNISGPPVITAIKPFGEPWSATINTSWILINSSDSNTYIEISENSTYLFEINVTDPDGDIENATYEWVYDDIILNATNIIRYNTTATIVNGGLGLNVSFGFFEASLTNSIAEHFVSAAVIDAISHDLSDNFVWEINATDVNRPIVFDGAPIPNITFSDSRDESDMDLWRASMNFSFYDPDYDLDGDGIIELAESNFSITYNVSDPNCGGYAAIDLSSPYYYFIDAGTGYTWIQGHGMTVIAQANGTCVVRFTATDGEYDATSNWVYINVTKTTSDSNPSTDVSQSSTSTRTITEVVEVPLPEEVDKPIPIDIIMPDMVTVYENNTIEIPLTITNTWHEAVQGVKLDYDMGNSTFNYSVEFKRRNFFIINPGEEIKTSMIITGYRVGGVYEIIVKANVTEPPYVDSAKIYLNSIEQTSTGLQVKTLIQFAIDLLHKNKECQELGEILAEADANHKKGETDKALELVNSVINGCKYLISQEQIVEVPRRFRRIHIPLKKEYLFYLMIAGIMGLVIWGGYGLFRKR